MLCNTYYAGFIYVGTFLHQLIHLTQYIAPLQADFNPSLNENATVLVYSTGKQHTNSEHWKYISYFTPELNLM